MDHREHSKEFERMMKGYGNKEMGHKEMMEDGMKKMMEGMEMMKKAMEMMGNG